MMQVRRILTAEEGACGNCGACLDWYQLLERLVFPPSHYYYNYYYIQLLSVHSHSDIIPSCQNPLKMMQLTHEARDEARLDLAEECELLIWSSGSLLSGNCKKNPNQNQTLRFKRVTLKHAWRNCMRQCWIILSVMALGVGLFQPWATQWLAIGFALLST